MEEEETLDFPIIFYKRSSSFVKGRLFEVDAESGVSIDGAFITSH